MRIKKRIHHLLQQIMNSNSEMFPSEIHLYINASEYDKSKDFYLRKEVLLWKKFYMTMDLIAI